VIERSERFEKMSRGFQRDPEYWAEELKLEFAEEVGRLMAARKMSRADLARRLGTSPAYVTRILRWTANLTLESMAKIALALDARVSLGIVANDAPQRARRTPVRIPTARRVESPHEFVVCDKPARLHEKK
jgi:transcriptional regulator with XRE-family HTH domain